MPGGSIDDQTLGRDASRGGSEIDRSALGCRYFAGDIAALGMEFIRQLTKSARLRSKTGLRIGENNRAGQKCCVGACVEMGAIGLCDAIQLTDANVTALIDAGPIAIGKNTRNQF